MLLQAFTILFILYEIAKMTNSKWFINLLNQMKSLESKKDITFNEVFIFKYAALFLVEMIYLMYTVVLLFTSYWYVGLLLLALALIYKKRLNTKAMVSDGIISIIVMTLVLVL